MHTGNASLRARPQKAMAMDQLISRKASSLAGVIVILLLLLLVFLCNASSAETVMETYIHDYTKSSFGENFYLSEWGLESSEHGRRLLQTNKYLDYHVLDNPDQPAVKGPTPGAPYNPSCQRTFGCKGVGRSPGN